MEPQEIQVTIDQSSGFCFGVVYVIEMAEDILEEENQLYCLGDIVHNDMEVKRLEEKGLQIIDHEQLEELHDCKVLIRAHGEPPSTYELAMNNNIELIDASCPVVLKLQNRITNSHRKGNQILIYGKHGHAEVKGLLGQTNNEATVFQDLEELNLEELPRQVTLFSQTTKSTDKFYEIKQKLEEAGIELQAHDTICRQVSNRDLELREFAKRFDALIFVAGRKSSNGKVLYNVCRGVNERTYFVSNTDEIQEQWLEGVKTMGICGATSTPMWLMEEVRNRVQAMSRKLVS